MNFIMSGLNFKILFTYHINIILEIFQNSTKLAINSDRILLEIKQIINTMVIIN